MIFQTRNRLYILTDQGDGAFLIQGHPEYCPVPTPCRLIDPVEVGQCLWANIKRPDGEFRPIHTSTVVRIVEA